MPRRARCSRRTPKPEAAELVAELRARVSAGSAAALHVRDDPGLGEAVEKAGTFEVAAVSEVLRDEDFDTVLGRIRFNDKGDVTGVDPFVWYVWKGDTYLPVGPDELTE
jgi:branched-chain amino acid transport system substrate-binding protein